MLELQPVFRANGVLLMLLGVTMFLPALIDFAYQNSEWVVFAVSGILTCTIGAALWLSSRGHNPYLSLRQAFLITSSAWGVLSAFGALPILWSGAVSSYTDAFFEAVSGLTTTGATVITGLDARPFGLLFWRSFLQWLGGVGIVIAAISILPVLRVGGMQLFRAHGFDMPDKILPRVRQVAAAMLLIFSALTLLCAICYAFAGMRAMDALIHAMTTLSTGGFSSKDSSLGYYASPAIDLIAIFFMCIGALPFFLYLRVLQGRFSAIFAYEEVRFFFLILCTLTLLLWIQQSLMGVSEPLKLLRHAAFSVTSLMTGTGFVSTDYTHWGSFPEGIFLIAMLIGGCAGSSSGGIKIFRIRVIVASIDQCVRRLLYPSGVFVVRFNCAPVSDTALESISVFFFLYILSFVLISAILTLLGLDLLTAVSGTAATLSNVGPGLGEIVGPVSNFQSLTPLIKWILSFAMLLGRLELFAILLLFMPRFWYR